MANVVLLGELEARLDRLQDMDGMTPRGLTFLLWSLAPEVYADPPATASGWRLSSPPGDRVRRWGYQRRHARGRALFSLADDMPAQAIGPGRPVAFPVSHSTTTPGLGLEEDALPLAELEARLDRLAGLLPAGLMARIRAAVLTPAPARGDDLPAALDAGAPAARPEGHAPRVVKVASGSPAVSIAATWLPGGW